MIVCLCKKVSCRIVKGAIADGANDVDAVGRACGAGTMCGGCRCTIEEMIDETTDARSPAPSRRLPMVARLAGDGLANASA